MQIDKYKEGDLKDFLLPVALVPNCSTVRNMYRNKECSVPKLEDLQDNQRGKLKEKYVVNILPFVGN